MANEEKQHKNQADDAPQQAGDNRRAGDTDGNASGGNSKSKGVPNPAEAPKPAREQTK
jgi:hypothetical protein